MSHVIRSGGSVTGRKRERTRVIALIATFLLLMAGVIVSAPGLMSVSATGGSTTPHNDDDDECENDDDDEGNDESSDSSSGSNEGFAVANDDTDGEHSSDEGDEGDDEGDDDESCAAAPTVTVHKAVINDNGGGAEAGDFILTVNGQHATQDTVAHEITANEENVISEEETIEGYIATSVECTSDLAGSPNNKTELSTGSISVTPVLAENIDCTITNDDVDPDDPATITVVKDVTNVWGGDFDSLDFELRLDGEPVVAGEPTTVTIGGHVVSELSREPAYTQTGIDCVDVATDELIGQNGTVTIAVGQDIVCTIFNADVPATLTLVKHVNPVNGASATAGSFQLQIDGVDVPQNDPIELAAGTHTVSEEQVADYRLVGIDCTDNDNPQKAVVYYEGVTLALGQNVTCVVTNERNPIDLSITKTDDGLVKVAGGDSFTYTLTVDNVGPRDASPYDMVTVTDNLPVGFAFVGVPAGCSATGQVLTCVIDAADLQVQDPGVVITVTVRALPGADSGTYTNIAYVDTPGDPPCIGAGCVPVCSSESNNVDCETTEVRREASLTIDKVDNVDATAPGGVYSYFVTVSNSGPSTLHANLVMTDDLPAELELVTVEALSPWDCVNADPVVCTYTQPVQPAESAPAIKVTVRLNPGFVGSSVYNVASATAVVDPPVMPDTYEDTGTPGTVVTATDDETTLVVRVADMVIDKSVSRSSASVGTEFNWVLDVTNTGPNTASNVVVSDTIPSQFQVIGAFPAPGLNCTNTTSVVQCTAPSMLAGVTVRVIVQVRVVATALPGTATNTATVTTESNDPDLSDNTDSASIDITAVASQAPVAPAQNLPSAPGAQLPRTGNNPVGLLGLGLLLLGSGAVSLVIARRRRPATV